MKLNLTTPRLRLRPWLPSDRAPFAALTADHEVMEHFPATLTRMQSDALADILANEIAEQGWGFWAAEVPGVTDFIGFVGIHEPRIELPIGPCVEIGWRIAKEHWGKGYASEAAQAALAVGFEQLGLKEIVSITVPTNQRSQRVMQRLGMVHRDEFFDHPALDEGHPMRRHILYRLTRDEWRAAQAAGK
jgi:RimJ/RimL family protein N-acetyltransferase